MRFLRLVATTLCLTTASGTLVLGNSTAYGPNLDTVTLAKFVAGVPTITRSAGNGS